MKYISIKEALKVLGISRSSIYKLISDGHLKTYSLPGIKRRTFLNREEFEKIFKIYADMKTSDIIKNRILILNKILIGYEVGKPYKIEAVGDKKVFFENGAFSTDIVLERFVTEEEWKDTHQKPVALTTDQRLSIIEKQFSELNEYVKQIVTLPIRYIAVEDDDYKDKKKATEEQLNIIQDILKTGGLKYNDLAKSPYVTNWMPKINSKKLDK